MSKPPVIVWFRRDLRLADNPALTEAVRSGSPILPVFILETDLPRPYGAASRWWLHHSLASLGQSLWAKGAPLLLLKGQASRILPQLAARVGAERVLANRRNEPAEAALDARIAETLEGKLSILPDGLLFEPGTVRTKDGKPVQVFTPFWRNALALPPPAKPLPAPDILTGHHGFGGEPLDSWGLLPTAPNWAEGFTEAWVPGEEAARQRLSDFLDEDIEAYARLRELWTTGWMHNRVRMIVASFLVKDLLIPWQKGEAWFWDTLVDADAGNNAGGWQWVAGCGMDAAPYFRIFNPILQGAKFDPDGAYVRRWCPELAGLPNQFIHAPWTASPLELAAARLRLGVDYPQPMVDHEVARKKALAALERVKA